MPQPKDSMVKDLTDAGIWSKPVKAKGQTPDFLLPKPKKDSAFIWVPGKSFPYDGKPAKKAATVEFPAGVYCEPGDILKAAEWGADFEKMGKTSTAKDGGVEPIYRMRWFAKTKGKSTAGWNLWQIDLDHPEVWAALFESPWLRDRAADMCGDLLVYHPKFLQLLKDLDAADKTEVQKILSLPDGDTGEPMFAEHIVLPELTELKLTGKITIYTDGCAGKDGIGASAFVAHHGDTLYVWVQANNDQTTSRAELYAAVRALEFAQKMLDQADLGDLQVEAYTDNQMVQNGFSKWLVSWSTGGWTTSNGQPVANQDLWKQALKFPKWAVTDWFWVKGHSGVLGNELCDYLAAMAKSMLQNHQYDWVGASYIIEKMLLAWASDYLAEVGHQGTFKNIKAAFI